MEKPAAHRKIELQSPEDLAYLITNIRGAARSRIDEAFPPVNRDDGEDDELRLRIEALVEEYITKTFTLASPNIAINGMDVDAASYLSDDKTAEPVYEPFDERKQQRVLDLAREEEDLLAEIAALKRNAPPRVAASFSEGIKEGLKADEAAMDERDAAVCEVDQAEVGAGLDVAGIGEDGEERWRGAVGGLGRLKREMAAVVAKMERARVAGEYVITQRK
ncbi:uncharacterized protein DNG_07120 [Cephalotrichum gorgonifer]|uniref:Kinetochore protein mis14 n=1 Tax=Cephalotrichum gorgonifer TaxID=2041049 RepID=A0AAE8N416_9PEZI|nr:uncharacterized protein DNG_07120 [Cephalotrichum gorgonifer]